MIKKIFLFLILLAGCVTPPYILDPIGGDRSGGMVELGVYNVKHSQPKLNNDANQITANYQCKEWGYDYAVPYSGIESTCARPSVFGRCYGFNLKVKYHCEYNKKD